MALPAHAAMPLAVLGDSDSHGYQDTLSFPPGSDKRGGIQRAHTLQWTEVLARLRGDHLDLGPREVTGMPGWQARFWRLLREAPRAPRKLDHRHNFAISGVGCRHLVEGHAAQVPALRALIAADPQRWRRGIVVIRVGINDLGTREVLDRVAAGDRIEADRRIERCQQSTALAVDQLLGEQPGLRIVLIGLFDNAHWAPQHQRWQDPSALARLDAHAERFDAGLRRIAADRGALFFSDRDWFRARWGGRDGEGRPAYRTLTLGGWRIGNSQGDAAQHATLADGHAGTLWNALWADALIELLNDNGLNPPVPNLTQAEILSLLPAPSDTPDH